MAIFTHNWPGDNNDPWDSNVWSTALNGLSATIQSGYGELRTTSSNGEGRAVLQPEAPANFDMTVTFRLSTGTEEAIFAFRGSNWTQGFDSDPGNGYIVEILRWNNSVDLQSVSGGSRGGVIASFPLTVPNETDYRLRVRADGTTIQVKAWPAANSEPGTWGINTTHSAHSTGEIGLSLFATTSARWVRWDDFSLTDLDAAGTPSVPNRLRVLTASSEAIEPHWEEVGDADTYDVRYSTDESNWTTLTGITDLYRLIDGLTANTEYFVQVRAVNTDGPSDWSGSGTARTDPATDWRVETDPWWWMDRTTQRELPLTGEFLYLPSWGYRVIVYSMDTGVRVTHEQFGGRWFPGFSAVDSSPETDTDGNGHGTGTASLAVGNTLGYARSAHICSVKCRMGSGIVADITDYVDCLDWVMANHPSGWRGVLYLSKPLYEENTADATTAANKTQELIDFGIPVVVAGDRNNGAEVEMPTKLPDVICAGMSDKNDNRSGNSSFGDDTDLYVPVEDITKAHRTGDSAYQTEDGGTSEASPQVAGVMAAILSQDPTLTAQEVNTLVREQATEGLLGNLPSGNNRILYALIDVDITPADLDWVAPPVDAELSGTVDLVTETTDERVVQVRYKIGETVIGTTGPDE